VASGNNLSVQAEVSLYEMRQSQWGSRSRRCWLPTALDLKTAAVRRRVVWRGLGFEGELRCLALSPEVVVVVIQ
jgi:hypothetical protein